MASIDWGMVGLGALIGVGCRQELRAAGRIAATTAASLAATAATAAQQVANETTQAKSAEEQAAEDYLERVNRKIDEALAGTPLQQQQQAGQGNGKKGH